MTLQNMQTTNKTTKNYQRQLLFIPFCILLIFSNWQNSIADTFTYPKNNPVFAITFPNNWKVDLDDELLHASPKDESIYLGLWALDNTDNLEAALDAFGESVSELISELHISDPDELEINGIPFWTIDGNGVDSDGDDVEVSVGLFTPDGETIFILLYFGTIEAEQKHEDELSDIVQSIEGAIEVSDEDSEDSHSNTYTYPSNDPVFSISFPKNWQAEVDDELLHAYPNDETIYLGLWALEDANNLEAAIDALGEGVSELVSELSIEEPEELEINEIQFMTIDGRGKDNHGDDVEVSFALFSLDDDETIFIMFYYGSKAAEEMHENELVEIVHSISRN